MFRMTGLAIAWLAPALALAQAQPPDTTVRTETIAPGIHVLVGQGGNIGVSAGPDGVFLIDDQYAVMTESVAAAIKALHPEMPRFLLNTHWHGDHTGGNENLAKLGSVIVAHEQVRTRMSTEQFVSFLQRTEPAAPPVALPIVTFSDGVTFHLNGDEIQCSHVPNAHTDGDVFVYFRKADVLHTGDLFFRMYPFIDISSGGSISGLIAAVDRLLTVAGDNTRIIPGHGPLANRADLVEYRHMLVMTSGRIRALIQAGKTPDEAVAAKPNADFDAKWAWSFITAERYVRMVYELVAKDLSAGRT